MQFSLVYVTVPNQEEAELISKILLDEKLSACVNIFSNSKSYFRWNGKIEFNSEVSIFIKTKESLVNSVSKKIIELHSYECPCIISLPITGGNPEFLSWIGNETSD